MLMSPFGVNEMYSLGYWLKDYGYYPRCWPLFTFMEHGNGADDDIAYEIESEAPIIFRYPLRHIEQHKKISAKPVYCLMNPTVHCRIKNNIAQSTDTKGTLFFPAHSTPDIENLLNWDEFILSLDNIPEHFKPIDICLHPTDINKGLGYIFIAKGYNVYNAQTHNPDKFAENFYAILKNYKYSMSNSIGSYTFYSVEMGIPFSLYGKEPIYFNNTDPNVESGNYESYKGHSAFIKANKLFDGFHTNISKDQLEFVNTELGKYNTISRVKASFLLYKAMVIYLAKHPGYFFSIITHLIKEIVKKLKTFFLLIPFILYKRLLKRKDWDVILDSRIYIKLREVVKLKLEYSGCEIKQSLMGKQIIIRDSLKYLQSLRNIFAEEVYRFTPNSKNPFILDCGANIGLSTIYFKHQFSGARIIAFEGNPIMYDLLNGNLHAFGYDDILVENKVVWNEEKLIYFSHNSGFNYSNIEEKAKDFNNGANIQSVRLKNYLNEKVDLLKLNIGGAQIKVIEDCEELLENVWNLFIEYHCEVGMKKQLDYLLSILRKSGFEIQCNEVIENSINIFAKRK
jgi:FkbM family methyltransferase